MSIRYEQAAELELDGDIERMEADRRSRRRPVLLIGVAALTLFFVSQILQLFPALAGFQVAKLTALGVVLLFFNSRERIASRVHIRNVPQLACILGMLAISIITTPFATWPQVSVSYIIEVYAKNVAFVYLLVQVVRSDRDSRAVAGALIAGCSSLVLAMLTGFGPLVVDQDETVRLSVGGSYDSNDLALLFVITIPFAIFLLRSSRPLCRALLVASIALMLLGIVKTGSRGGFLGLVVIGALIVLRSSAQTRKYTLITIASGALLFASTAPPQYWNRISTIYNYENDYNLSDESGRLMIWKAGFEMIANNPITGVGISCFAIAHVHIAGSKLEVSPHNSFLQVAAELGIPGLLLFTAIILVSLRAARRIRRRARAGLTDENFLWVASAVEVSFIGFVVSGSLLTHAYSALFCFLTGMGAVLVARHKAYSEKDSDAEEILYA